MAMVAALAMLFMSACSSCEEGQRCAIGPPIGRLRDAVAFIESQTCDFMDVVEDGVPADIDVHYERRSCGVNGASPGRIYITDPETCPSMYASHSLGMTVHEILHALGHWPHDTNTCSVMYSHVRRDGDWVLEQDDINWIMNVHCKGELVDAESIHSWPL